MARKGKRKSEETTEQSTEVGELIPQPHGGAIRYGGTNKGGPGRPPDEFKRAMRELASHDEVLSAVAKILRDPDHPQWLGAWKWATERGYGKSPDNVEISGPGGGPVPHALVVKFVKPDEE
jgi:hypothetical protein